VLTQLGLWLRQQREARGWARREMARRLIQAGQAAGDTGVPGIDSMSTYVRRWEHGQHGLTERYRLFYCAALGIPPGQFGKEPPHPAPVTPGPARPPLSVSVTLAYREIDTVQREVLMTAHESSDHAEQAEQPGIGDVTFDQLRADVARLAGLSDTGEPFTVFLDARRVRDRIYRLLDRRMWPREQTGLYFLLGCLNDLMGEAAFRLSYPDAAEELLRAGFAYANAIDHRPLMAELRCVLSTVAYFRGRFEESRELAISGLQYLSAGPKAANLHINHARAAGRLGDADAARQAVRDAHEARDRDYNDELLEIGGGYVISEATHHGKAGEALTATADAVREAAEELVSAIGLYDEGPRQGEDHWFAGKPLAGIDLAVVRLRSGALDAAAAALQPALSLPAGQRISSVTIRLGAARDELAAPVFRGSAQARALGEQIEEFGRETVVAGLHSLPGPG
jgi:transcriptional regulator with XRE-family HTH domain/tetratricopeptide (TPR) repeat protein